MSLNKVDKDIMMLNKAANVNSDVRKLTDILNALVIAIKQGIDPNYTTYVNEVVTEAVEAEHLITQNAISQQNKEIDDFKEAVTDQVNSYKPVVIEGDVTNAADEEDITSENNLLKLKNRSALNGMGYVILRRGSSFASQVTLSNTIYEVRYNFDLDGAEVTIPANCVLQFTGGSISNGTLNGTNTDIKASITKIFGTNLSIGGTWCNSEAYPEWFGDVVNSIESANKIADVRLLGNKIYYINHQVLLIHSLKGSLGFTNKKPGGLESCTNLSTIAYVGDGQDVVIEGDYEKHNSCFLIHTKGIKIEDINLAWVGPNGSITLENGVYNPPLCTNPSFSAIKLTTDTINYELYNGMGAEYILISRCQFNYFPIGINLYDLGEGEETTRFDVSTDQIKITDCRFKKNDIGINVYNASVYDTIIEKCCFEDKIRNINLIKGHIMVIEGYFAPLSGETDLIKASIYCSNADNSEISSSYYTLIGCYSENHYGYFLYDVSKTSSYVASPTKTLLNCVLLQANEGAPKIDGKSVNIYFNARNNILNMFGGRFAGHLYCGENSKANIIGCVQSIFIGTTANINTLWSSGNTAALHSIGSGDGKLNLLNRDAEKRVEFQTLSNGSLNIGFPGIANILIDIVNKRFPYPMEYHLREYKDVTESTKGFDYGMLGFVKDENNVAKLAYVGKNYKILGVDGYGIWHNRLGETASRPILTATDSGFQFFDTTLGKPIYWQGTKWVDATGADIPS